MASGSWGARKPQLRKDPVFNRWVLFSPARAKRPSDFKSKSPTNPNPEQQECPFCIGHEAECAPEIFRVPPNNPDWKIRVIQNLYPAVGRDLEGPFVQNYTASRAHLVGNHVFDGFGFHDVVIETPYHSVQLSGMSSEEIGRVFIAYKRRMDQISDNDTIQYVQVFKNHGASAGASMSHSHSQMLALPIIPPTVSARLDSMRDYNRKTGKCCICEMIQSENILIKATAEFFAVVPHAAAFPFEIWIIPQHHTGHFQSLSAEQAVDLGGLLKLMLRKMSLQLNNPPYNFMIHTGGFNDMASHFGYTHWFIQIVPQLSGIGGFEMGSGCYINPVFPDDAAKVLREVNVPESG